MKQHITKTQFLQLSVKNQDVILKFVGIYDEIRIRNNPLSDFWIIDIGLMIKFLGDNWHTKIRNNFGELVVFHKNDYFLSSMFLCNFLWNGIVYEFKNK